MNKLINYASPDDIEKDFIKLADYFYQFIEGDDVLDEAFAIFHKYDLVDEEGFWR